MKRTRNTHPTAQSIAEARRRFLAACGKFAVAAPPAISLVYAGAERDYATVASGGGDAVPPALGYIASMQARQGFAARLR
jgi:hypothetical protein